MWKTQKNLLRVVRREIERVDEYFKNRSETKKKKKCTVLQQTAALCGRHKNDPSLNYVHILIPDPLNVFGYMARGD